MIDTERLLGIVCDDLCKYPSEYKDSDELWNARCDKCPLQELLDEEGDEDWKPF